MRVPHDRQAWPSEGSAVYGELTHRGFGVGAVAAGGAAGFAAGALVDHAFSKANEDDDDDDSLFGDD